MHVRNTAKTKARSGCYNSKDKTPNIKHISFSINSVQCHSELSEHQTFSGSEVSGLRFWGLNFLGLSFLGLKSDV